MAGANGKRSGFVALGGVMAAGSVVLLWLACVAPAGRTGLTACAGLFPAVVTLYAGQPAGYLCWAAASLLGLFLLPDKSVALLFAAFLGLYPVAKGRLETLERRAVEWGLKLSWFELALTVFWFAFEELLGIPEWMGGSTLLLYGLGSAAFVIYDIGLSRLITLLRTRISRV